MIKQVRQVAVYGAAGHTGQFVMHELARRGIAAIAVGRNAEQLAAVGSLGEVRIARVENKTELSAAFIGADAIINCAGPFFDTALPLVDAALHAGIPYLDVAPEQAAVQMVQDARHADALEKQVTVVPAAAFYGGLADLLATAVAAGSDIDDIAVGVGLDRWHPTPGTRLTGQRNTAPRVIQRGGRLEAAPIGPLTGEWDFPAPIGRRQVVTQAFSEIITLASHLEVPSITSWMNLEPLADLSDSATPAPEPSDATGRSSQHFVMDVVVRTKGEYRRACATGRDIYHISAPIIVEAAERLLTSGAAHRSGVHSLGALFDARSFLAALGPRGLCVSYTAESTSPLRREPRAAMAR